MIIDDFTREQHQSRSRIFFKIKGKRQNENCWCKPPIFPKGVTPS